MKITEAETRFLNWAGRNARLLFCCIITLLAVILRISCFDYVSRDYQIYLLPWYQEIASMNGAAALGTAVGNYNIPYQTMIWILTRLPLDPLYAYKTISCICDFILAFAAGRLAVTVLSVHDDARPAAERETSAAAPRIFCFVYAAVLFLPTVFLNSAEWAQCDSIFSAFILLSLLFLFRDRFRTAFILLGAAFAFKLQAVFILPFFLYYWFSRRNFSLLNFLWIPGMQYILSIPGFVCGRSLLDPIAIYSEQTDTYKYMYLNFQSFWTLLCSREAYSALSTPAVVLTAAILGCGLLSLIERSRKKQPDPKFLLQTAAWTVYTCVLFLPAMHERYGYLAEVLLVLLACLDARLAGIAAIAEITALIHYGTYLYGLQADDLCLKLTAAAYTAAWLLFSIRLWKTDESSQYPSCLRS
jgi:Gpi18-like mannosyltransferase